jgi:allophanate hydrolase
MNLTGAAVADFITHGGSPVAVARAALDRIAEYDDPALFLHLLSRATVLSRAEALAAEGAQDRPLYGWPFVVKDNIDVAGLPTTAACPDYAYVPGRHAPAVQRLLDAGPLLLGKVNLDQFATGLNGTRSPHGTPRNAVAPDLIPGGSSSGSATAVAAGIASFSLGTDTAGSGRVPAMCQNIVGLKPSLGLVPSRGVVPACRSIDCISVFALTVQDAATVLQVMAGPAPEDPYSRAAPAPWSSVPAPRPVWRIGVPVPEQLVLDGPAEASLYQAALARAEDLGAVLTRIDIAPLLAVARRLYDGAWVAERSAALRDILLQRPDSVYPVTRGILEGGLQRLAVDAFDDFHAVGQARLLSRTLFAEQDLLLLPTAPGIPSLAAMLAQPIAANSRLGTYTNFANLCDLSALALPAGFHDGTPFGVTLLAPAWAEAALCGFGAALHHAAGLTLGATDAETPTPAAPPRLGQGEAALFCIGAHMAGLPLNHQVTELGGRVLRPAATAADYRLFDLGGRPGMVRVQQGGASIIGEAWALPRAAIGALLARVPAPLGFGTVTLQEGESMLGFLCEAIGTEGRREITAFGGWRAWHARRG